LLLSWPARAMKGAVSSTERPFLRDGGAERFGRQGCWARACEPNSPYEGARPGSDVGHRPDGRRSGS
jgi:hypothetical protein